MSGEEREPRFVTLGRAGSAFHLRIQVPRVSGRAILTNVVSTLIGAALSWFFFPADVVEVQAICQEPAGVIEAEPVEEARAIDHARRFMVGGIQGVTRREQP